MSDLTLREEKGSPLTHEEMDNNLINLLIPAGAVFHFAMESCPSGYLICDGSLISRTEYSRLFSVIGTTYGEGDGINTFNLPDLRDIFIRGKGEEREIGSYQDDALQNIKGNVATGHSLSLFHSTNFSGAFASSGGTGATVAGTTGSGYSKGISLDASRVVRTADETRPKNIALLPCIKY